MKYTAPADQVTYEEDPVKGTLPLQAGGYRFNPYVNLLGYAAKSPECWNRFSETQAEGKIGNPLVFLHERYSPQGKQRLIGVMLIRSEYWQLFSVVFRRNDSCVFSSGRELWGTQNAPLRLFAGQSDPVDTSHFTIKYGLVGQTGTIDGWLQDDDKVKIKVRGGPAKKP